MFSSTKRMLVPMMVSTVILIIPLVVFSQTKILPDCDGPSCNWSDFMKLIENIINFVITLAIVASSLVFAYAGWLYMTSGGDSGKVKQAHSLFQRVLVGLLLALGGYLIVDLLIKSLGYKW